MSMGLMINGAAIVDSGDDSQEHAKSLIFLVLSFLMVSEHPVFCNFLRSPNVFWFFVGPVVFPWTLVGCSS